MKTRIRVLCALLIISFATLPLQAVGRKYHSELEKQEKVYRDEVYGPQQPQIEEPGSFAKFLGWWHGQRNNFDNFVKPNPHQKESFLAKAIKLPFKIGSAILSPIRFIKDSLIVPILTKGFSYPAQYATSRIVKKIQSKLFSKEELQNFTPQAKLQSKMAEYQLAYSLSGSAMWMADRYINKALNKITYKFLSNVVPSLELPDPSEYPKTTCSGKEITYKQVISTYKDLIIERIFNRFEEKLPQNLQNGKAFEYYQAGKTVYGHARLVYDLVDNTTAALSIAYQLTDHYEKLAKQSFVFSMPMTRLKKTIMGFDIISRCADSYVKIIHHFNLGENSSRGMKIFNKGLSYFVKFAKAICPRRDYIVGIWETSKMLYTLHKMQGLEGGPQDKLRASRANRIGETIKTLATTKYKMSAQDAHKLEATLIKINHKTLEGERERHRINAEKILAKYNTNLATFTFALYMKNPAIAQLKNILVEKYQLPGSEAPKLILAMLNNNQLECEKILTKYNISQQQLMNDPSIRKIQVA